MKRSIYAMIVALLVSFSSAVYAVNPDEILADSALEQRARAISANLRCLVCQNQSIDDSDAQLARDLRILVREQLVSGSTDKQVMDFVVSRYGEFVLLRPTFSARNWILWLTPILALVLGSLAFYNYNKRLRYAEKTPLTADEENRIAKLLDGK